MFGSIIRQLIWYHISMDYQTIGHTIPLEFIQSFQRNLWKKALVLRPIGAIT